MKFNNYYHNETNSSIVNYYHSEGAEDIRITSTEYNFLNGEHFFVTSVTLSGNWNEFGGIGFKHLRSKECQSREEADMQAWKKIQNWMIKTHKIMVEVA